MYFSTPVIIRKLMKSMGSHGNSSLLFVYDACDEGDGLALYEGPTLLRF
jgi:hypothetical protein